MGCGPFDAATQEGLAWCHRACALHRDRSPRAHQKITRRNQTSSSTVGSGSQGNQRVSGASGSSTTGVHWW